MRKEEVFSELVNRLTVMGIEPLGALDYAPSLVEKRIWVAKKNEGDRIDTAIETAIQSG